MLHHRNIIFKSPAIIQKHLAHKIDAINRAPACMNPGLHGLLRHHDSAINLLPADALKVSHPYHPFQTIKRILKVPSGIAITDVSVCILSLFDWQLMINGTRDAFQSVLVL